MFQPVETERGQLEVWANKHHDEIKENKSEVAKEKEEKVSANTASTSLNSKKETDGGATPAEPGSELIVWWDEPADQDPENPMNWSSARKWINIFVISVISFLV